MIENRRESDFIIGVILYNGQIEYIYIYGDINRVHWKCQEYWVCINIMIGSILADRGWIKIV